MALFLPTYFSPIAQYIKLVNASDVVFEFFDNYQKQTYRNRCYIYGANGKQLLNIPISHLKNSDRKKTRDVLVDADDPWQSQHLKSIDTAYSNSPFYEFYKDDLLKIFTKKYRFLLDVNIDSFEFVMDALQLDSSYAKTTAFEAAVENDFRSLANAKQLPDMKFQSYIQQFDHKHGFLPNLSILDLLFMEGPNTISYLEKKD